MRRPTLDRFEALHCPEALTGCWLWLGSEVDGYGRFWDSNRLVMAHRWAYEHYRGPIPSGLQTDHLCRNRCCVNPWHLELVTQRENVLRGNAPAARQALQTHCIHGHLLSGNNVRMNGRRRVCRACDRIRSARRKKAKWMLNQSSHYSL